MTQLESSVAARERTPGWAAFVGIASGDTVQVALPVSVDPYLVADHVPHIRPLLAAARCSEPAGLVTLTTSRLTLFELRGVVLQEIDAVDLAAHESALRRRGRPGAPSAPARQPGPMPDRRAWRRRNRLATAAAAFADRVARRASSHHWDLVVASGDQRMRSAFARRFPTWRTELVELVLPVGHADPARHVPEVAGEIERIRGERLATALSGIVQDPATIWGAVPVLAALRQARVADLIVAEDLERKTAETLIHRALPTGAAVVPVPAGALGPLAVAGRARWPR
jgi:hypothetical protein